MFLKSWGEGASLVAAAAAAAAPVCVGWSPKRELYVLSVSPYLFYDTKTDFYDPSE